MGHTFITLHHMHPSKTALLVVDLLILRDKNAYSMRAITNITRTTSSFHADHIISNILVRLRAEKDLSTNHNVSSV